MASGGESASAAGPAVGDLVVVSEQRARGVGRLVAFLPDDGPPTAARVFFYAQGAFGLVDLEQVAPAPPGPSPSPDERC